LANSGKIEKIVRKGARMTAAIKAGSTDKAQPDDYFTYVLDVGYIPRDIYKYVKSDPLGDLPRYSVHIVIQHIPVFTTFIALAATGIPLHYSDVFWAPYVLSFFGGIDAAQVIHRSAAFVMIGASVYHVLTIAGSTISKIATKQFDIRRTQVPLPKDLFDVINDVKYFLGFSPYRPKMEKFMYKQKLHYLAILWGNFVLIFAGTALLYPEYVALLWPFDPSFVQDLARIMHADEAIMALIVVAIWHLSNVHLVPGRFPAQWTVFTGKITREHQLEEHFLEYVRNLSEIPEEREYMRSLLDELGYTKKEGNPNEKRP
jgi:formate dehydrogenase subunit gamma